MRTARRRIGNRTIEDAGAGIQLGPAVVERLGCRKEALRNARGLVPSALTGHPKFLIVTYLGIYDTYAAIIPHLIIDAAGIFIMKQFFDSVSVSIEEAARMDGASVFRTFWSVILPMARPALITLTILAFQGSWNEFSHFLVVTQSPELRTMITGLASLTSGELGSGTQYPLKMGAALLTTIPVALLFFTFQRYFVRGANEGAEKG